MSDLSRDFVTNFVHGQLKRSIRVLLEAECLSAAVVLIYSGMDTMAWISMPAGQTSVTRTDFIAWASRYIRFPYLVLVSVKGLAEAFFRGVDTFLIDVFADKNKAGVAEARLEKIVHEFPVGEGTEDVK